MVAVEAAGAGTASAGSTVPTAPRGAPDPEVRAVAKRRQFNAAYKLSVLEEADRCANPGAIWTWASPDFSDGSLSL